MCGFKSTQVQGVPGASTVHSEYQYYSTDRKNRGMCQGCLIGVACKRPLARAICRGWLHIHLQQHPMFHKHITHTCSSIVVDSSAKRPRHTFPASDISAVEMRDWRAAATACAGDALVAAAVGRNASNNWSCGGGVARAPPQRFPALFSRVGP